MDESHAHVSSSDKNEEEKRDPRILSSPLDGKMWSWIRYLFGAFSFYFVWGACVWSAVEGYIFLGAALVLGSFLVHLLLSPTRWKDCAMAFSLFATGVVVDTLYLSLGAVSYISPHPSYPWLAPLWVASLYVLFGMSVDHSLCWLKKWALLPPLFGAGGGALSYLAGERLGAVFFLWGWGSIFLVAGVWALLCPLSFWWSTKLEKHFFTPGISSETRV